MEIQMLPLSLTLMGLVYIVLYIKRKNQAMSYWPIFGTLPSFLWNLNRLPEWMTEAFNALGSGSFYVDEGLIPNVALLVTCDPRNLDYILKTNFNNFPKGSDFKEIFDALGDGIFNADNDSWRLQRKLAHACLGSVEFRNHVNMTTAKIVEEQLLPFLAHVAKEGSVIDFQDVCKRFTFDSAMSTILGRVEKHLSIALGSNILADSIDEASAALLYRHAMPMFLWKFMRWLKVGKEKKLAKAWNTVDSLLQEYISLARKEFLTGVETADILSTYVRSEEKNLKDDKFLRDIILSLFIGGRDTISSGLTWFMWLLAKTPRVEGKILQELALAYKKRNGIGAEGDLGPRRPWLFDSDDLKGLVYLHASICESLRLYHPIPLNSKGVNKEDVLPDGTVVKPGVQIILSLYSSGRMPWIWGEDCLEFKPERWIDSEGKLSHEPLSKLFAFNSGPRSCLGKNMTFTQMKAVIAAIVFNYKVELVEGHTVGLKPHLALHMESGLLVKVKERS